MKDLPWIYPLLIFIFILGMVLFSYQMQSNHQDQTAVKLNEVVQTEAMCHLDRSDRVKEGTIHLDRSAFEQSVREKLTQAFSKVQPAPRLTFSYLEEAEELKGIRVQLKVNGQTYQTTYALDLHSGLSRIKT